MVLELDPEEVEEVLRVTAMALAFPSLPADPWSSSNLRPITGVWDKKMMNGLSITSIDVCFIMLMHFVSFSPPRCQK